MSETVDDYLSNMGIEVDGELKHYGKKGMKWGVRKEDGSVRAQARIPTARQEARAEKKAKRAAAEQEIHDARFRQGERANALERQAFKTYAANGEKAIKAATNKYARMETELLTNPDAATAATMTRGEKVTNGIVTGMYAGLLVGSFAVVATSRR